MTRLPTAEISIELLNMIFAEFDILDKANDCRLVTEIAYATRSNDPNLPNCISQILKHFTSKDNQRDKHIATSHVVLHGSETHWHGTDFTMYDVKLVRPRERAS